MKLFAIAFAVLTIGCGSAPEAAKKADEPKAAPAPPKVKDDTALLLDQGRISATLVPEHLLGNKALPGGSLGEYESKGSKYELFVAEAASAQDAAFALVDIKATLTNPEYLPHMGGYFGMYSGKPLYVFSKGKYIAGVAGLPQAGADEIARELAVRLR